MPDLFPTERKANRRARRRTPRKPTVRSLENIALFYLGRYAASEQSLRRVLENRIRRAAKFDPQFAHDDAAQQELRAAIGAIIEKHKKTGVLNDAAYAEMKIASMRRAGRSARAIKVKLLLKGVKTPVVEKALADEEEGTDSALELKAALALARRRKLGPFGKEEKTPAQKQKDFATMARAGFSLDIVRQVLGKTADDVLDDM